MPQDHSLNPGHNGYDDVDAAAADGPSEVAAAGASAVTLASDLEVDDYSPTNGIADPGAAIQNGMTSFALASAHPLYQPGSATGSGVVSAPVGGGISPGTALSSADGDAGVPGQGSVAAASGAAQPIGDMPGAATNGASTALNMKFRGFNYVADIDGSYAAADSLSTMIADTGANAVALTADWGIDPSTNTVYDDAAQTETDADITATATEAEKDGLSVMFRPLIDFTYDASQATLLAPDGTQYEDGTWRAAYDPAPAGASNATFTTDGIAFLQSYKTMIVQEAKEAQAAGVQIFDIGTEIDQLTGADFKTEWNQIITAVKAVYGGKLTYSAIWDDSASPWDFINSNVPAGTGNFATQVSFWSQMDYIGIDEYAAVDTSDPNFTATPTTAAQKQTDLTDLIGEWENAPTDSFTNQITGGLSLIQFYENLSTTLNKPLLFTELGYESAPDAASAPFFSSFSDPGSYDPALQTLLYQAFVDAWEAQGNTSLQGVYIWNWEPDPNSDDPNPPGSPEWTPQGNTGALQVLDAAFANSITVVAETNTASVAGREGTPDLARGTAGTTGTGALAGDSDPAGTLSVTAVQGGTVGKAFATEYGSLTLNSDGSYLYSPTNGPPLTTAPDGSPPVDTITYTVGDGNGNSATSTLSITVYRDPTAVSETGTIDAGGTLTATASTTGSGALAGDFDPDGASLSVSAVDALSDPLSNPIAGKYGTLTLNSDGSYSYTAESESSLASDFSQNNNQPLTDGFELLVSGPLSTFVTSSLVITVNPSTALLDDLNGDSRSDILWRNTNGIADIWASTAGSGGTSFTGINLGNIGTVWTIEGTGDFNGSGADGILWRNANGQLALWNASPGSSVSFTAQSAGAVTPDWSVAGIGDFTGDGTADILWRNTDGQVALWASSAGTTDAFTAYSFGNIGTNWSIVGVGDFTGNGKDGILWRNSNNGDIDLWASTSGGIGSFANYDLGEVGSAWSIAGIADFTGQGTADILWQNTGGQVALWESSPGNPGAFTAVSIGNIPANWSVVGTGDYNDDGKAGILWRNTSGTTFLWNSTPGSTLGFTGVNFGTVSTNWAVANNFTPGS